MIMDSRQLSEASYPGDLICWYGQMAVIAADAELGSFSDILVFSEIGRRVVNSDVQHVHSPFILAIVASHVGAEAMGFHHHGYSVQLGMTWVKDVTTHLIRL